MPDDTPPAEIILAGSDRSIRFPPVCAACAAPSDGKLRVERSFARAGRPTLRVRNPVVHAVAGFDVPFCATCRAAHTAAVEPPSSDVAGERLVEAFFHGRAGVIAAAALLIFGFITLAGLVAGELRVVPLIATFFFLITMLVFGYRGWARTHYLTISPPTAITSAVDFSDNLAPPFEAPRRRFRLRHPEVARRFAAANSARVWQPNQLTGRAVLLLRTAGSIAMVLLLLVATVWMLVAG